MNSENSKTMATNDNKLYHLVKAVSQKNTWMQVCLLSTQHRAYVPAEIMNRNGSLKCKVLTKYIPLASLHKQHPKESRNWGSSSKNFMLYISIQPACQFWFI